MILIPAGILFILFVMLSLLHFYWAFGGRWGFEKAIPGKDGVPLFNPGRPAIMLVAVALVLAAVFSLWRAGLFELGPEWMPRAGVWAIALVFGARAVGDFRYCGFFKRIRDTAFAGNDSLIYSPLCAFISLMAIWLSLS